VRIQAVIEPRQQRIEHVDDKSSSLAFGPFTQPALNERR
jgi:hypothetical protein